MQKCILKSLNNETPGRAERQGEMNAAKEWIMPSEWFEDADDCLTAARKRVADDEGLDVADLTARWENDQRENIIVERGA